MLIPSKGRYIPVFAATIYDKNAQLVGAGLTPINLTSIMIGSLAHAACEDTAANLAAAYRERVY